MNRRAAGPLASGHPRCGSPADRPPQVCYYGGLLLLWLTAVAAGAAAAMPADAAQGDAAQADAAQAGAAPAGAAPLEPEQESEAALQSEIAALIQRLGHPSYASRLRAREELQRLGLVAFDALHDAQFDPDSEVAMAARHLVSSLHVQWATETDPPAVREYLEGYGTQSELERRSRMAQLANLPEATGVGALCRLARFETSLRLSREAALLVMRQPLPDDPAARRQLAQRVLEVLGPNARQASQWLRQYAAELRSGSFDAKAWRQLIDQHRQAAAGDGGQTTDNVVLLELIRVAAVRAQQMDQPAEAFELADSSLDLVPPTPAALLDATIWALDHGFSRTVLELRQRQSDRFDADPQLLYGAAEALQNTGSPEAAEKLSRQALQIDPLPPLGSEAADAMTPDQRDLRAYHRREIGLRLKARGQFEWAEREFRHVVDSLELTAVPAVLTRTQLAQMLSELQRYQEVVDTLQPLVDRLIRDQALQRQVQRTGEIGVANLKSQLHFHQGMAKAAAGEIAAAQQQLDQALQLSRENADILIAMYRLPGDEAWQLTTATAIRAAARGFEMDILTVERRIREQGQHQLEKDDLVEALNNYAWLVANTFGDQQKALRYSLRSLELEPEVSALLDTCARCYFAVGQIEQAVATQRRAVRLEPNSPPLVRQLAEFEAALAADADQGATPAAKAAAAQPDSAAPPTERADAARP